MSTHALIGVRTSTGYKAKFIHWDGYTSNIIPIVKNVISRSETFHQATEQLLANHWSSLNKEVGVNHEVTWYTETNDIDAEYLYILDDFEVQTFVRDLEIGWVQLNLNNKIAVSA